MIYLNLKRVRWFRRSVLSEF